MKIKGIIVEYNPLHNGHVYHFNNIPKEKDDIIIAVMSSSLVNRGELSVFNKFDKTSLALELGVDLIIELPAVYTIQSGEVFAKRAVEILSYAGAEDIYIGSEANDINIYDRYYTFMKTNKYNDSLKKHLKSGESYKSASQSALNDAGLKPLLANDTLGLYYYKAILDNNYPVILKTIKRTSNYSSPFSEGNISSATSIRLNQSNIKDMVPEYTYNLYTRKGFIKNYQIFPFVKANIFNLDLNNIFLVEEGFENTLKDVYKYNSYDEFLSSLNTKRYSIAKIERIMLNILFNITKEEMNDINNKPISYIRVLGYSSKGKLYLSEIKHDKLIYTNIKEGINPILDVELRITKIIDTIYNTNLLSLEQKGPIE